MFACLCRVDAVQQYLAGVTGIPIPEQILMCDGSPLDASKPLSVYRLPVVSNILTKVCSVELSCAQPALYFCHYKASLTVAEKAVLARYLGVSWVKA